MDNIDNITSIKLCKEMINCADDDVKNFVKVLSQTAQGNNNTIYIPKVNFFILLAILTLKIKLSWDIHPQEKIKDLEIVKINEKPKHLN